MIFLVSVDYQTKEQGPIVNYQAEVELEKKEGETHSEFIIRVLDCGRVKLSQWCFNVLGESEPIIWGATILQPRILEGN